MIVCATAAIAAAKPSIAVLGLEVIDKSGVPSGEDVNFAKTLTEDLRGRAKLGGPYQFLSGTEKELIDLKLLKGCEDEKDLKCMSSIGGDMNVDFLMYGAVTKKGGTYEVTITLLDVKNRKREKTAPTNVPVKADPQVVMKAAQKIYNGLTGQSDSCTITIKTPGVDRATILIGTKESGNITNGVGTVSGLNEGKYTVAIEAKDYHRWSKDGVQCTGGETTNLSADLSRNTKVDLTPGDNGTGNGSGDVTSPPGSIIGQTGTTSHPSSGSLRPVWKTMAYGGLIGAAAGGAVWIYGWANYTRNSSFTTDTLHIPTNNKLQDASKYNDSVCGSGDGDAVINDPMGKTGNAAFHKGCQGKSWTTAGIGITVGFAAVSGIGFLLLSLSHDNAETPPATVAGHRKHHEPFAITPVVSADGAGATFRMEW